jgi:hypothetical protein
MKTCGRLQGKWKRYAPNPVENKWKISVRLPGSRMPVACNPTESGHPGLLTLPFPGLSRAPSNP